MHEFSGFTTGVWELTAWIYVPGDFNGSSFIIVLNSYDDAGANLNWSMQAHFDSASGMLVTDSAGGESVPYITDQWVEYRAEIDLDANMQTVFYNGAPFYTASWTEGISGGGALNVAAIDLFANNASAIYYDDITLCSPTGCEGVIEPEEPQATIAVQKAYSDDNPMPAEITLSCNTGLPLVQHYSLDPDRFGDIYVEFVVNDFADGEMDCEVTEADLAAYTPTYLAFNDSQITESGESCVFENIEHGERATSNMEEVNHVCFIGNTLNVSEVVVTKDWIDDNPQFNAINYAEATWFCSNIPVDNFGFILPILGGPIELQGQRGTGITDSGNLEFIGDPGVDSFFTLGNWDGGTMCTVTEEVVEGGVEVDSSDCQSIVIGPGEDASCTIVNTRLYEGIPTLSQYGLGLLALLMLGMGFVAFRRLA